MTKEEAFKLATKNRKTYIDKILHRITEACNKGEFSLRYREDFTDSDREELIKLGYTVKYYNGDFRDNDYYLTITWV